MSSQTPLISIITVVYNGALTLEQTIQSVINQTYNNIEYIIIDGGSTDGTIDIINKFKPHIAKWVSESDKGLYDAMNKGIRMASGELIGMINSDDWYDLNAVEIMVKAYIKNPDKTIFHANRFDVLPNGNVNIYKYNKSVFKLLYYGMTYNHPSMFIAASVYTKHTYDTNYKVVADYKFILEAFLRDKDQIYYVDETIVYFRLGGISASLSLLGDYKEGLAMRKSLSFSVLKQGLYSTVFFAVRLINYITKR